MAYKGFSANHNPWITEMTKKNEAWLKKKAFRWYAHGDQKEDDGQLYFCASCDAFLPSDHFPVHDVEGNCLKNREKHKQTLKTWKAKYSQDNLYRRPPDPPNLFG